MLTCSRVLNMALVMDKSTNKKQNYNIRSKNILKNIKKQTIVFLKANINNL